MFSVTIALFIVVTVTRLNLIMNKGICKNGAVDSYHF